MPTFKAPYGTKDQHVISPARHRGFRYIVAYLVDGGCRADYIEKACIEAEEAGAPKDAVHSKEYGGFFTRGEIKNPMVGRRLDTYARALTKYEQELRAERST